VRKPTKRQRFDRLLAEKGWNAVGAVEWEELRGLFSESSLREWLKEAGVRVEQPYRGVETKTLDELEHSLGAMTELYLQDAAARKTCRAVVITAKDRTRFASRNQKVDETKRALKSEMVDWMLVWLDDPAMFSSWVTLRKRALRHDPEPV
jgi:hypothetical protein